MPGGERSRYSKEDSEGRGTGQNTAEEEEQMKHWGWMADPKPVLERASAGGNVSCRTEGDDQACRRSPENRRVSPEQAGVNSVLDQVPQIPLVLVADEFSQAFPLKPLDSITSVSPSQ